MKKHQQDILLKIFSGPHIGAELSLMPGEYTIGNGDECDIVLQDASIARRHAILQVTEEYIDILPLENKQLLIAGKLSDSQGKKHIDHYSVITVGTTHLAVGTEDGDWSKVILPKLSANAFTEKEANRPPETPIQKALWIAKKWTVKLRLFMETFLLRSQHVRKKTLALLSQYLFTKKGVFALSISGLAAMLVISSVILKPAPTPHHEIQKRAASKILGFTTAMGFTGVTAEPSSDSGILVTGHLDDHEQLTKLSEESEKIDDVDVNLDIYIGSDIQAQASKLLHQLDINSIDVLYRSHGVLTLSGYHANQAHWEDTKSMIINDIPGVLSVDTNAVKDIKNRVNNLRNAIEKTSLAKKVAIESQGDNILVSGILANKEIQDLRTVIKNFRKKYGASPAIEIDLIDSQNALDIEIKSVRIGEVPYIITTTGARYLTGAFLPNGFTVKSIASDKIVIQKNHIEVVYPLN